MLKNAGPVAAACRKRVSADPEKTRPEGLKDMVRLSDARMSGTAFGTIVLHIAPEAAVGGPLAAVRNGDRIRLSVKDKRLELRVDEREIARRLGECAATAAAAARLPSLYARTVLQAQDGCDFDFLGFGGHESPLSAAGHTARPHSKGHRR